MNISNPYIFWFFLFSVLAFVIAMLTWFKSLKIQKKQQDNEERRQNLEELKMHSARLTAWIAKGPFFRLIIENRGAVAAVFREIKLDGIRLNEHPTIAEPQREEIVLGPNTTYQYELSVNRKTPPPEDVEIVYDDERRKGNRYRTSLSH